MKRWCSRRSRERKMKRSTKKAQKIKQIGYQEEESSKKKEGRKNMENRIRRR